MLYIAIIFQYKTYYRFILHYALLYILLFRNTNQPDDSTEAGSENNAINDSVNHSVVNEIQQSTVGNNQDEYVEALTVENQEIDFTGIEGNVEYESYDITFLDNCETTDNVSLIDELDQSKFSGQTTIANRILSSDILHHFSLLENELLEDLDPDNIGIDGGECAADVVRESGDEVNHRHPGTTYR